MVRSDYRLTSVLYFGVNLWIRKEPPSRAFRILSNASALVNSGLAEIVKGTIRFWNGSKIFLCHCKDENDIYQYQGAEMHVLMIDEATHFTNHVSILTLSLLRYWFKPLGY